MKYGRNTLKFVDWHFTWVVAIFSTKKIGLFEFKNLGHTLGSGEKNILPNLTNSQEPELFFWPLGAGAARQKYQEPEPLEKKYQEPEPLEKKVRSRRR